MRTRWLSGFLLLTAQAVAAEQATVDDCCDPCCSPVEGPPSPTCYFPSFYESNCDEGICVNADFLYWYGTETKLAYATKETTVDIGSDPDETDRPLAPIVDAQRIKVQWKPGVRIALCKHSPNTSFRTDVNWTYYENDNSAANSTTTDNFTQSRLTLPDQVIFYNPWTNASPFGSIAKAVRGSWKFKLNYIEVGLSKQYWTSSCMTMQPIIGIAGSWTDTRFTVFSEIDYSFPVGSSIESRADSARINWRNDFWGVGFFAGLQPSWHLGCGLSLFSVLKTSLLWGEFEARVKDNTSFIRTRVGTSNAEQQQAINNKYGWEFYGIQPIIDVALGLEWSRCFCEGAFSFLLDIGWEHHIWFGLNARQQYTRYLAAFGGDRPQADIYFNASPRSIAGDVAMGGLFVRAGFGF